MHPISLDFLMLVSFNDELAYEDPLGSPLVRVAVLCCDWEAEGLLFVGLLSSELFISMVVDPTRSEFEDYK
ncbi:hypothetical protein HAX54_013992, partial [Datura stramonium]|nr:hypothetical protein [Datura stramonium]